MTFDTNAYAAGAVIVSPTLSSLLLSSALQKCFSLNDKAITSMQAAYPQDSVTFLRAAVDQLELAFFAKELQQEQLALQQLQQLQQRALFEERLAHQISHCSSSRQNQFFQSFPPPPASASSWATTAQVLAQTSLHPQEDTAATATSTTHRFSGGCPLSFISVSIEAIIPDRISSQPHNVFTLYPRMLCFLGANHESTAGPADSDVDLVRVYLLLLYNLAMSRHVLALLYLYEHPDQYPDPHLTPVLLLYEMIFQVAHQTGNLAREQQEQSSTTTTSTDRHPSHGSCQAHPHQQPGTLLHILVAAANNIGHIASHMGLFCETRQSIQRMFQLLATSQDQYFCATEDLQIVFYSLCIFLEGNHLNNAPAA